MSAEVYRYDFEPDIENSDVEANLSLALIGTEALRGETATQLGASHYFDIEKRVCLVDAGTDAGRDFNALFAGYLRKEFGPDSFRVRRVHQDQHSAPGAAA